MSFLRIAYSLIVAVPLYFVFAVLFGAPLLSHFEDTFVFALVLAALTAVPLTWSCGDGSYSDEALSNLIFEARFVNRSQLYAHRLAAGAIIGALLGTVVIPLDWDVYWQKWPIPCVLGTIGGGLLGAFVARCELTLNRGKIVDHHSKLI